MGGTESKPRFGHHILKVEEGSPAEHAGLSCFFDFVVAANGVILDREDKRQFIHILSQNVGKEISLLIYNSKDSSTREAKVVPSDSWGGEGLLGIRIRFCSLSGANEHVWHVLEVYQDSPAAAAGLDPFADYIVGTNDLLFSDSEDFFTLVQANMGTPTPLYVYNLRTDAIRQVVITPNQDWGGNGSLGCNVGYGYLHRIPHNRDEALESLEKFHPLSTDEKTKRGEFLLVNNDLNTDETYNETHNEEGIPIIPIKLDEPVDVQLTTNKNGHWKEKEETVEEITHTTVSLSPEGDSILPTTSIISDDTTLDIAHTLSFERSSSFETPSDSFRGITPVQGTPGLTAPTAAQAPASLSQLSAMHFHTSPISSSSFYQTSPYSTPTMTPSISTLPTLGQPNEAYDVISTSNIKFPEDESTT